MLSIVLVYFALLVSLKCNWSNDVCRYMYSMMSHVLCTVTEWSVIETLLSNVYHDNPQVAGGGLHRASRAGEAQDRAG